MKKLLLSIFVGILATGCATVKVQTNRTGEFSREESKWQTGLIGALNEDIVVKHEDGSCVRVTWNKIMQMFLPIIMTEVHDEKPCQR